MRAAFRRARANKENCIVTSPVEPAEPAIPMHNKNLDSTKDQLTEQNQKRNAYQSSGPPIKKPDKSKPLPKPDQKPGKLSKIAKALKDKSPGPASDGNQNRPKTTDELRGSKDNIEPPPEAKRPIPYPVRTELRDEPKTKETARDEHHQAGMFQINTCANLE
jgi:hypothetical protein